MRRGVDAVRRLDFSCIAAGNFCCSCKFACRVCGAWRRRGRIFPVSLPATFVVHASSRAGCAARGAGAAGRPDFLLFRVRQLLLFMQVHVPGVRRVAPARRGGRIFSCFASGAILTAGKRPRPGQLVSATKVAGREAQIFRPPSAPDPRNLYLQPKLPDAKRESAGRQRARPAQLVSASKVAGSGTQIFRPPARPTRATCICKQSCRTRDANLPAAERARPAQLVSATKVAGSGTQIFRAPAPPTRATCICNRLGAANVPAATRRG